MTHQKAALLPFSKMAPYFNYIISMDTKGPINPASEGHHYIYVIVDHFSNYIATVPAQKNNAHCAIYALLHHWISKFGPPQYFVTDRGSEYINTEMTNLCVLFNIKHSPRTPHSPWTNGLVEVQNKNLGTHLRMFLYDTPENWSTQVHFFAYAHNTQPLSHLNVSPHEIVLHMKPRIPLNFNLNLTRNHKRDCTAQYCSALPPHSHYKPTDLNPLFYSALLKPISTWFLTVETAMLQIYSRVHQYALKKINSLAHTIQETTNPDKPLPLNSFVLHRNFKQVQFSDKLKPLRNGPFKIINKPTDVTYELLTSEGFTFHTHRNHLVPYYPKEPLLFPHIQKYKNVDIMIIILMII